MPTIIVRREIDWIDVPLREQRPFLGICLGAQMLAKQLGAQGRAASARPSPRSAITRSARPRRDCAVCPDWPDHVYHWHREGFELPVGRRIAGGGRATFRCEAFRFGHAFGFQFHPDVTYAMMHCWTTRGHDATGIRRARGRATITSPIARCMMSTERAWLKQFIDGWLARMPLSIMAEAAE